MHLRTESLLQDFKHLAIAFYTQTPFERFSIIFQFPLGKLSIDLP